MDLLLRWLDEGTTAETRDSTGLETETDDVDNSRGSCRRRLFLSRVLYCLVSRPWFHRPAISAANPFPLLLLVLALEALT